MTPSAIHRRVEVAGIVVFILLWSLLASRLIWAWPGALGWALLPPALLLAHLSADLISGVVHFLGDNFGNVDTPYFGRNFIAPFRQHHRDPQAIIGHDFVELSGDNALVCLPTLTLSQLLPVSGPGGIFVTLYALALHALVLWTNAIHRWAHLEHPPRLVALLQRTSLILTPDHHAVHHRPPHHTHYCITAGWLDRPLERMLFAPLRRRAGRQR